jgi:hypothetical protein
MDKNDYWRRKLAEGKDHAADGKKSFKISAIHKRNIVIEDLGRAAMDDEDVTTSRILSSMLELTEEDMASAGNISVDQVSALYDPISSQNTLSHLLKIHRGQSQAFRSSFRTETWRGKIRFSDAREAGQPVYPRVRRMLYAQGSQRARNRLQGCAVCLLYIFPPTPRASR